MEFFRHCPECGRRFHIKLESKKLVGDHMESIPRKRTTVLGASAVPSKYGAMPSSRAVIVTYDDKPMILDVEEFQYAYKCGHCGHEWSEKHLEEHKVS